MAVTKCLPLLRRDFCFSDHKAIYRYTDRQVILGGGVNSHHPSEIQLHSSDYSCLSKLEHLWGLKPRACLPLPLPTELSWRGSASLILRILPNATPWVCVAKGTGSGLPRAWDIASSSTCFDGHSVSHSAHPWHFNPNPSHLAGQRTFDTSIQASKLVLNLESSRSSGYKQLQALPINDCPFDKKQNSRLKPSHEK